MNVHSQPQDHVPGFRTRFRLPRLLAVGTLLLALLLAGTNASADSVDHPAAPQLTAAEPSLGGPCDWLQTRGRLLSTGAESALMALCARQQDLQQALDLPSGALAIPRAPQHEGEAAAERPSGLTPRIEAQVKATLASTTDMQVNAPDFPLFPDQTTQSETAIAVSGDNVVVGWNDSTEFVDLPMTSFSGYAFSNDGGTTFTDGGPVLPGPIGPPDFPFDGFAISLGDPDLTVDAAGNFYFSNLTLVCQFNDPQFPDACFFTDSFIGVWKSVDGGATFAGPTLVRGSGSSLSEPPYGFFQDKELIAADITGGANSDNVYVSWTEFDPVDNSQILFSRSTDGGLSFGPPVTVTLLNGSTQTVVQGSFPEVGPDGEIYVAWEEGWPIVPVRSIRIRRSDDGGLTFGAESVIHSAVNAIGTDEECGTQTEPNLRETLPGSIRSQEYPSIDVDRGDAQFLGNVYAVWNSDPDGPDGLDNADIFFSRSTDGGATWSAPLVVNDDDTATDQFFPFVRVTDAGTVAVMWYDRRLNVEDIDVFKAFSTDGGVSFGPNIRVTDVSFPVPPINPNFDPEAANCYMAEYNHMAAQGSILYLAWGDNRNTLITPDFPAGRPDPDVFFETEPDPEALNLVLTPQTDTNRVKTDHSVTAAVSDGVGNPVAGQTVAFRVSGVNTASGSDTTDAAGEATFTYTGNNAGDDAITAWADKDGDGVQDLGEPFDVATKTWLPPQADLSVAKSDSPDPVNAGDNLTYTINVVNHGPDAATDVVLIDTLPPGMSFVSATPSQGTCSFDALSSTVVCDLAALSAPTIATSTFDNDDEGWTVVGDAQGGSPTPDYSPTGGNPGGHVSAVDDVTGMVWYWRGPSKFQGDVSAAYGHALTFDLRQSNTSNPFDSDDAIMTGGGVTLVLYTPSNDGDDVIMIGGGVTLVFNTPSNPGTDWTAYSVLLDESAGWENQATGLPATEAEMLAVLSSLTDLQIRGEYRTGPDSGDLDNVVLYCAPASATVTIVVAVDPSIADETSLTNTAEVTANEIDPDPSDNTDTEDTAVAPTAIELISFTAKGGADHVILAWETASEIDSEGFNLWRSKAADGAYAKLNASLIPAQGNADTGASYDYTDGDVVKGTTYTYKLEDVDLHGVSTFHGPVSATPGHIRIYLPLFFK